MFLCLCRIAAVLMIFLIPQAANAATIVETYRFDARTEGPIPSFTGTATVEIDDDGGPGKLLAFDLKVGDQVFTPANVALLTEFRGRILAFQPIIEGVVGARPGYDAFFLAFDRHNPATSGAFGYMLASEPENPAGNGYKPGGVVFTLLPSAVPEPATWAMMILGFLVVGAALRRRRSSGNALVSG